MSDVDLVVIGGGPAGIMTGLLFARSGCTVRVLEKHSDFFRDFRGDTVHPSTMEVLHQLGMLDRFLKRPFDAVGRARIRVGQGDYDIGDLSHLRTPAPFIAMMPQWDFLDFLRDEASAFPGFSLQMDASVASLIQDGEKVSGVKLASREEHRARLVIAADGRSSIVRRRKMLPVQTVGAPMDVLWFRVEKSGNSGDVLRGSFDTGRMAVLSDRRTYWQAAYIIPKGSAESVKARGVGWLMKQMGQAFPDIDFPDHALRSVDDLHLLKVALDRLTSWHRPGLLAIGDAAHAMSPIGGIGINLAIQDAVAAANALAEPLAAGADVDPLLQQVQKRRMLPTRLIQAAQKAAQDNIVGRVLEGEPIVKAPLPVRLLNRFPRLRRIPGRMIGLGIRRERVRSPLARR